MNKNEEIVRLWSEMLISLAEAQSELRRTNRENVGPKRPAESKRDRKMSGVKRQRVSSHKSHNLSEKKRQRELIRSKLETLKEITPNCPKSDIVSILDSVIQYMSSLQFAVFLTILQNSL